jgi:hypothetical protein
MRTNKWPQMNADENKMLIRVYLRSSAAIYLFHSFSRHPLVPERLPA